MKLLEVRHLSVSYRSRDALTRAVRAVSLDVNAGETLGLAGESGCGKSTLAAAILRLLPEPPAEYAGGEVLFQGKDILRLSREELRRVRGAGVGMVFQDPFSALNPVLTVQDQLEEIFPAHGLPLPQGGVEDLLARVRLADPARVARSYPHQLSGGQRQRVCIALAIALNPKLLIADEPTTALDATIQGEILDLLDALKKEMGLGVLLVSHNIGLLSERADRLAVMYAGEIVETGPTKTVLGAPHHPYTRGLLASLPRLSAGRGRLPTLPGQPPDLRRPPSGCAFRERCPRAVGACAVPPSLGARSADRLVACHNPEP
jgi:oligopeptide/dipeptide ABC transporter ATP-binding protein